MSVLTALRGSKPTVPWFESEHLDAYLERSAFDATTVRFIGDMARDGVAVVDLGEKARALCDQAVAETEPYFTPGITRVQDAWRRSSAVRHLASWPPMRRLLRAAYGRDPFPFQTLNFRQGSQQSIHSDAIHFHADPERFMCGVWIALEDVQPGAGPLIYHPGSHKLPVMTMRAAGVNSPTPNYSDYEATYVPRYAEAIAESGLPRTRALLKKGQAFVWAANLAHGGSPIDDPGSTRRSLVVHNYFAGCLYYTPMYSDVEAGRLLLRLPPDVRTGFWRWPRRKGCPVRLSPKLIAGFLHHARLGEPIAM